MSNVNMWEIENSFYCEDIQVICGVDEAGRVLWQVQSALPQ